MLFSHCLFMEKIKLQSISYNKIIITIVIFMVTGFIVFIKPVPVEIKRDILLNQALSNIPGWESSMPIPIEQDIIRELKLDDYINQAYSKNGQTLSLYIGSYNSSKKVGAAHDPTVCFPGQGWLLSDKSKGKINLNNNDINDISYSNMIATLGDRKEVILYWFQAFDIAKDNTFSQKITLAFNRLLHKGEDNAFVRVTAPLGKENPEEKKKIIIDFVQSFYPVFINYLKQKNDG